MRDLDELLRVLGVSREELPDVLRRLEIPDRCPCDHKPRLLCVLRFGESGCEDRQNAGDCDCPLIPPPPCKHILKRKHKVSLSVWALLLLPSRPFHAKGDDYFEREATPKPARRIMCRMARIVRMAKRRKRMQCLYHPRDRWRAVAVDDKIKAGAQAKNTRNGALDPKNTTILAIGRTERAEQATPGYPREMWDVSSLRRLVEVKPLGDWQQGHLEQLYKALAHCRYDPKREGRRQRSEDRAIAAKRKPCLTADEAKRRLVAGELERRQPSKQSNGRAA